MIEKYDTLKDKDGKTWRVLDVDVQTDMVKIKGVNENGKLKPGRVKEISMQELGEQYRKIDLPPVHVTVKPAPNLTLEEKEEERIDEMILEDGVQIEKLRAQIETLEEENETLKQAAKDLRKTISKMHQEHAAEVEELNDRIMELEILAKKKNEYADALDDDSIAFGKIRMLAVTLKGLATSIEGIALMIQDETEGRT